MLALANIKPTDAWSNAQARIIDRNRDDLSRATNSKDNNYSLNQPILEVLREFPNGQKIKLSPGQHNQLHADIVHEFFPHLSTCSHSTG
ncbi:BsuBI/PstI family type II restriction endonuclease [Photorhabdus stackebrandtii]|uniref:BsuBI/PstI family type II restriction endonuclease n=1 Tax=Photorhabdus stackebrandtii TaxID=1123042 RepID=UPI0014099C10|nr:BsuBI/PstI family type II restriction endonuclease [Photorhabdus stackebrandtii]